MKLQGTQGGQIITKKFAIEFNKIINLFEDEGFNGVYGFGRMLNWKEKDVMEYYEFHLSDSRQGETLVRKYTREALDYMVKEKQLLSPDTVVYFSNPNINRKRKGYINSVENGYYVVFYATGWEKETWRYVHQQINKKIENTN